MANAKDARRGATHALPASEDSEYALSSREKYRRIAEHRRYPKKKTYSFDELALGLTAMEAGVNRYYAMHAGRQAKRVLDYLAQGAKASKPETKAKALTLARKYFSDIERQRHPELAEQIENRILWEEGWRPETWDAERNAPRAAKASVNPETGMQEFWSPWSLAPTQRKWLGAASGEPKIESDDLPPIPGTPSPGTPAPPLKPPTFPTPENPDPNDPKINPLPTWPKGPPPIEHLPRSPEEADTEPCAPEKIAWANAVVAGFERISERIDEIDALMDETDDQAEQDALSDERQALMLSARNNSQELTRARATLAACRL